MLNGPHDRFRGDVAFLHEAETCVRSTVARGREKLRFLTKLPYILTQVDFSPGHAQRALDQYAEAPAQSHHRATEELLAIGSPLREAIVRVAEGGELSHLVFESIQWLKLVPLDDSVGESPHACARHTELHTRGAKFGWLSSTHRLQQHLAMLSLLTPQLSVSLQ